MAASHCRHWSGYVHTFVCTWHAATQATCGIISFLVTLEWDRITEGQLLFGNRGELAIASKRTE